MTALKYVLVKHMSHNGPWLLIKTRADVRERIAEIKMDKPNTEVPIRLKLLGIVKEPLPPRLQKVNLAWPKVDAALRKAHVAWQKADAAWREVNATRQKADAAWRKAYAALQKADAAWQETYAAWEKAIVTKEGVAFHEKVCGCGWTPKQPDILQIAAQQKETA